jgi:2-polyprenyl-6-methoxyphenol hydroxylase-like FAD-dependent oxidoreductase
MAQRRAVVIGASVAGLCAARALEGSFERVTVVDRDACPDDGSPRAGVPQARHVHALIARGALELEQLFPGFLAELRALGAHEIDFGSEAAVLRQTGWQRPMRTGVKAFLATRDRLEAVIRARVRASPKVELLERVEVSGLLVRSGDPSAVRGILANRREGGAPLELEADLVVDASGRSSRAPAWLEAIGREAPVESVVDSFAGYSSRWYRAPDPDRWPKAYWWKAIWLDPELPGDLRGAVMFPVEEGRWIVTLIGYSKRYPPTDEEGFERALLGLRSPVLARSVALAEPLTPVYSSRSLSNRLRRFDRLSDPIKGFVAVGDSVSAYNPVYGQGMTVAALCARALSATLAREPLGSPGFEGAFFKEQARVIKDAWALASGADMRFPGTQSERPPAPRAVQLFAEELTAASLEDVEVLRRMTSVYFMLKPNAALFEAGLVARVLRSAARRAALNVFGSRPLPPMPPPRVT